MTAPIFMPPLSEPISSLPKKKRVLLVDASPVKRDLRANAMRNRGMEVDSAADISEARSWWRADLYNLVLISLEHELGQSDQFCDVLRSAVPPQQIAFLVGKPGYLADAPNLEVAAADPLASGLDLLGEANPALPADVQADVSQRWGILEASRRISEVRSVSAARSTAMRNRPTPPRDMEVRFSARNAAEALLAEFQKEEIQ